MKKKYIWVLLLWLTASTLSAKIELPSIFTDHMVLQQQTKASLWGKAAADKKVSITTSWNKKTYTVMSDQVGKWKVKVDTPIAGGPYSIAISDGKEVRLNDVLIGEVWVCSGQSNMEMTLRGYRKGNNHENDILAANHPQIRLLHIDRAMSSQPLDDFKKIRGGWKECSSSTVPAFSAVAYYFGRNLHENLNVPIGLISSSVGGTIAEAWTSFETLKFIPDFKESIEKVKNLNEKWEEVIFEQKIKDWNDTVFQVDKGLENNLPIWADSEYDDTLWTEMHLPGVWTKDDVVNLDGVVWFRKTIEISKKWAGKSLQLSLGLIDDDDITYFNGERIGATKGTYTARVYQVPARLVKNGKAVITIRVSDYKGKGGVLGNKDAITLSLLKEKNSTPISLVGNWKFKMSVDFKNLRELPKTDVDNPNRPTVLFNAMIHPMTQYTIQGVIWYQGESNCMRAYQYKDLFPLLIADWRKQWEQNLPFYFVQLANFGKRNDQPEEAPWAELREAQLKALHVENTGMAVSIDIGEADDVHPINKQDVGLRLALAARANTYGEKISFSGPLYQSYLLKENKIMIFFKHADNGLFAKDGKELKGFTIAGPDHIFHNAKAIIDCNSIIVNSPNVPIPLAVRYAWAANPECNLVNGSGLPASPFRTDDWKLTEHK